jgi:DNA polymerase I
VAHLSQDRKMIEVFNSGIDLHSQTAQWMFNLPTIDDVDEVLHRYPAKRTGFGIIYGISAHRLYKEMTADGAVGWTQQLCQEAIDKWFGVFYGIKEYMQRVAKETKKTKTSVDMWGRMELVPEMYSCHEATREAGLRKAVNQRVQGGAQGIAKKAMLDLWPVLEEWQEYDLAYPVMQIHDDLVFEVREEFLQTAVSIIQPIMENTVKLVVPLKVDPKAGRLWGSLKKINK